jgi:phosphatidylethanolamine/phosphatidyl-N-methylethanolamine N-methyltransferase
MKNYYKDHYQGLIQEGSGKFFSNYVHKIMEMNLPRNFYPKVLELGALNGLHKQYITHKFDVYYETDILIEGTTKISNNYIKKFQDAENLNEFKDDSIDRVIATCMLSHLKDPEVCLEEIKRILSNDGLVTLWVSNDPSILLRIFQNIFRKNDFKRSGLDYDSIQYREHLTYFTRLNFLIYDVFQDFKIQRKELPFRKFWYHLNFVSVYQIHK